MVAPTETTPQARPRRGIPYTIARSGFAWDFEGKPLNSRTTISYPGPPPWHPNCRSTLIPLTKGYDELVSDPDLSAKIKEGLDKMPPATRASMNGYVAADLTYPQWLRSQPAEIQRRVLGPGRQKLFAEGNLSLRDLVDESGRPLTLAQLRAKQGIPAPARQTQRPFTVPEREAIPDKESLQIVQNLTIPKTGRKDEALKAYRNKAIGDQAINQVDGDTFDQIDSPVMLRGIKSREHLESNLSGERPGEGIHGSGTYYGAERSWDAAGDYGGIFDRSLGSGWIYAAKLHPSAKVIHSRDLAKLRQQYAKDNPNRTKNAKTFDFDEDDGNFALRMGYDAIITPETYRVVLNNQKLVVDKRSLPGGSRSYDKAIQTLDDKYAGKRKKPDLYGGADIVKVIAKFYGLK